MKPDSHLPKLPSLSELLKHPAVEQIVDQVNQTTIAQRATGFLEEITASLPKPNVQAIVPSIHQLAERLAQRLLEPTQRSATSINATGAIWGERWQSPPLAESAVHEMLRVSSEYQQSSQSTSDACISLLKQLTGAEAAWIGSSYEAVAQQAKEIDKGKIEIARHVGLVDPADYGMTHVETITSRFEAGCELIVCDGGGLLGGPTCGIVLGKKNLVQELISEPTLTNNPAEALTLAALVATLEIYKTPEQALHKIPALQLLLTPLENLQQRCERLATLLAESELVSEAQATQCDSAWYDTSEVKFADTTWAIKLVPTSSNSTDIAKTFQASSPQIVGRVQPDAVWLDLRATFPRWDQQLVSALEATAQES